MEAIATWRPWLQLVCNFELLSPPINDFNRISKILLENLSADAARDLRKTSKPQLKFVETNKSLTHPKAFWPKILASNWFQEVFFLFQTECKYYDRNFEVMIVALSQMTHRSFHLAERVLQQRRWHTTTGRCLLQKISSQNDLLNCLVQKDISEF